MSHEFFITKTTLRKQIRTSRVIDGKYAFPRMFEVFSREFFFFFEKSRQSLYFQIEIFKDACVSRVYLENFRKDLLVPSYSYLSDNYTTLM